MLIYASAEDLCLAFSDEEWRVEPVQEAESVLESRTQWQKTTNKNKAHSRNSGMHTVRSRQREHLAKIPVKRP